MILFSSYTSPMAATTNKRKRGGQPDDEVSASDLESKSKEKQEEAMDGQGEDDVIVTEEAEDDGDEDDGDEDDYAVSENAEDEYKKRTEATDTSFGRVRHVFRFFTSFAGSLRVFFCWIANLLVSPVFPVLPVFPRSPPVFPSLLFVHLLLRFLRGRILFLGLFTGNLFLWMDGFP
jgi:hypothetical protein